LTPFRWVFLEAKEAGIRTLTLARPPVNALGRPFVEELGQAIASVAAEPGVRCLVVRSGLAHFSAGADLKERQTMTVEEVRAFVPKLAAVSNGLASLPFPTIAAVRGTAAGGGLELALACDLRIVSEGARLGLRETALAIVPGAGGTQRLARIAGIARAKRWIFTARLFSAREALADGVVEEVVPDEELDPRALALAAEIASNGPVAVRLAKKAIEGGFGRPLEEGLALEWDCYQGVLDTEDRLEALRAFAEKRPPKFEGR